MFSQFIYFTCFFVHFNFIISFFFLIQASSAVTTAAAATTTVEEQRTFYKKKYEKLKFENQLLRKEVGHTIIKSQRAQQALILLSGEKFTSTLRASKP